MPSPNCSPKTRFLKLRTVSASWNYQQRETKSEKPNKHEESNRRFTIKVSDDARHSCANNALVSIVMVVVKMTKIT